MGFMVLKRCAGSLAHPLLFRASYNTGRYYKYRRMTPIISAGLDKKAWGPVLEALRVIMCDMLRHRCRL